ncbi:MAG: glycosyltransferase [Arachnia sp.]
MRQRWAWLLKGVARILVAYAGLANHVVCATEAIAQRYNPAKRTIVHNYPPLLPEEELEVDSTAIALRPPVVVYVGGLSELRGARVMVDAFANSAMPDGWGLAVAGCGPQPLMDNLASSPGWARVRFLGQVPSSNARELIRTSRVGLVLFSNTVAHRDALPTKMFEYFAAGVPVIASDFPLWRRIIEEHECGLLVDEQSPTAVAEAIRKYAEDPLLLEGHSQNARRAALKHFNWASEARALLGVYRELNK